VLTAGFSKVSISPPIGAPLAGFAARQGMCEGIHDELFSRALVLENNGKAVRPDLLLNFLDGKMRENSRRQQIV